MNNDVKVVKELGEKLGYGHLMSIATSLWKANMIEQGYPTSGIFVPTCMAFIKDEHKEMHETGVKHYDNYIK
jgi:hypothetical protein